MKNDAKIFGIGLSKTGTTSLYAALDVLGYRAVTFRHLKELGLQDWRLGDFSRDYLAGIEAATDLPIATYFRELDARYPGSKFILTERPTEPWLKSVERQFSANPEPKDSFNRDIRLAHYGVVTYNESRFARLQKEHSDAVRSYFKDRPDDLLCMNVFEGDQWPQLCGFLGKDIPSAPYPTTKPETFKGAKPTDADVDRGISAFGRFAFVIPVVHPKGQHVTDYSIVERCLRATLTSLTAQSHHNTRVVVVCHQAPEWAADFQDSVNFLTIGDHPAFAANLNDVQIDKGMKYAIGALYAQNLLDAELIMPADGDDFMHSNTAKFLMAKNGPTPGRDGFIFSNGYNACLFPHPNDITLTAAYKVEKFDLTCGTCRVFLSSSLRSHLNSFDPEFCEMADRFLNGTVAEVPNKMLTRIAETTSLSQSQPDTLIRLLGRHVDQAPFFDLAPLKEPMPAKGCGHGNHDGPLDGDIHWHRVRQVANPNTFLTDFGLAKHSEIIAAPSLKANLRGQFAKLVTRPLHKRREKSAAKNR